jgi:cytochrome c oxidase cbb3-type subunit 3
LYAHTFEAAPSPDERLQAEMVKAAEAQLKAMEGKETTDQSLLLVAALPDRVAAGRKVYEQFCVVCHSQQGEGNVGPNLTDPYWIHGGRPLDIHRTITEGVPEKGMVAWGNQLGPLRVQDVTAYVISIKNTNVAGKAPQGEPETAAAGGDSAQVEGAPAPGPGVDDARTGAER